MDTSKSVEPKQKKKLKTRGRGSGKEYEPFIKIHEISSSGESVRIRSATVGRTHHLLSGIERDAFLMFDQLDQTTDLREQFPLPVDDTLEICRQLGIKHPQQRGYLMVVSTDLLVDFADGKKIAIAIKPVSKLSEQRTIELLQIEKSYWECRGVAWHLFTEREVTDGMRENLKWIQPYVGEDVADHYQLSLSEVDDLIRRIQPHPQAKVSQLCAKLDDQYSVEPGFHLSIFRYAVAQRFIKAPFDQPFHSWQCKDLAVSEKAQANEVFNAS
ncbi:MULTISPECIES: TnsA endonuclease N-terminal domain-containing protein [Halomonadaceae]|uniref:TnsA endonuclease N-terminal domain-containing protein n=1 Tax=Halomonadaceae TaxID=28256 RepID=UPI000C336E6D|nr:TnsA endonuclease N-terminal domain-containing protein [Halomonas sp. MES3-P3E]PKG54890.1 heteromeric transposase endonuclease subunit TnsA [Halomonas sp. MES3-P3E]